MGDVPSPPPSPPAYFGHLGQMISDGGEAQLYAGHPAYGSSYNCRHVVPFAPCAAESRTFAPLLSGPESLSCSCQSSGSLQSSISEDDLPSPPPLPEEDFAMPSPPAVAPLVSSGGGLAPHPTVRDISPPMLQPRQMRQSIVSGLPPLDVPAASRAIYYTTVAGQERRRHMWDAVQQQQQAQLHQHQQFRHAPRSLTDNLPTARFMPGSDETTCMICLGDFTAGEQHTVLPRCLHHFHTPCAARWLAINKICPVCRTPLM